jgi:hypothetical protein
MWLLSMLLPVSDCRRECATLSHPSPPPPPLAMAARDLASDAIVSACFSTTADMALSCASWLWNSTRKKGEIGVMKMLERILDHRQNVRKMCKDKMANTSSLKQRFQGATIKPAWQSTWSIVVRWLQ